MVDLEDLDVGQLRHPPGPVIQASTYDHQLRHQPGADGIVDSDRTRHDDLGRRRVRLPPPTRPYTYICGRTAGLGSAADPASGADIPTVVSHDGRGLFDPSTGAKIARDLNSDPDL